MEAVMADELEPLVLDLLEWVASAPRTYAEFMDAWRTSCPRLPVWEDALDRGLVQRRTIEGGAPGVVVTDRGRAWLAQRRLALACGQPAATGPKLIHERR
jgi:hypothetical protein